MLTLKTNMVPIKSGSSSMVASNQRCIQSPFSFPVHQILTICQGPLQFLGAARDALLQITDDITDLISPATVSVDANGQHGFQKKKKKKCQ